MTHFGYEPMVEKESDLRRNVYGKIAIFMR